MAPQPSETLDWDAPETRTLPVFDRDDQTIHGTRRLWHTFDYVQHYGWWSYRELVDMARAEESRRSWTFEEAFMHVVAWRAAEVRLWCQARREKLLDALDNAAWRFRSDFAQATQH